MKVRYFIIGPTAKQRADGDTLYCVVSTTKRCSFDEIYSNDWFVDEFQGSREEAIAFCKNKGMKRPFIME